MSSVSVTGAKARLSAIIKEIQGGDACIITSGRCREPVAVLLAYDEWSAAKHRPRIGGSLKDRMSLAFADDWHMTDAELLSS